MPESNASHKRKKDMEGEQRDDPRKRSKTVHEATKDSDSHDKSKPTSKDKGKGKEKQHKDKHRQRKDKHKHGSSSAMSEPPRVPHKSSSTFAALEKLRLSAKPSSTVANGGGSSSNTPQNALAPLSLTSTSAALRSRHQTEPLDAGSTSSPANTSSRKQTVDGVSDLRIKLQKFEKEVKRHDVELGKLRQDQRESEETAKMWADVAADQAAEITVLQGKIAVIESTLLKLAERKPLNPAEEENVAELRKVTLNKALGAVMYKLMGLGSTQPLPEPLPGDKEFWTTANEADESFLRPKFDVSFTNNSQWHRELYNRLKQDGPTLVADFAAVSNDVTLAEVKKRMSETVYKNMQKKWKTQHKPVEERQEKANEDKKTERKIKKAASRAEVRDQFSELEGSEHDFMFHSLWQSTDSDRTASAADDERSDSNSLSHSSSNRKVKKARYWLSKPPNFRSQKYNRLLRPVKRVVKKLQVSKDKDKPSYARKFTKRRSGLSKPVDKLPDGKKGGLKTPKWAVGSTWRIEHPDQEVRMTGTTESSESTESLSNSSDWANESNRRSTSTSASGTGSLHSAHAVSPAPPTDSHLTHSRSPQPTPYIDPTIATPSLSPRADN